MTAWTGSAVFTVTTAADARAERPCANAGVVSTICAAAVLAVTASACWSGSSTGLGQVRGVVRDTAGAPVVGVTVHARDRVGSVETDAEGAFELPFAPGQFTVMVDSPEIMPSSRDLLLTTALDVELEPFEVQRLPARVDGVHVATSAGYTEIPAAAIRHDVSPCPRAAPFGSPGRWRVVYLEPANLPRISASTLTAVLPVLPSANWGLFRVPASRVLHAHFERTVLVGDCTLPGGVTSASPGASWTSAPDGARVVVDRAVAPATYCFVDADTDREGRIDDARGQFFCFEVAAPEHLLRATIETVEGIAGVSTGGACSVTLSRSAGGGSWICRTRLQCGDVAVYEGVLGDCILQIEPLRVSGSDGDANDVDGSGTLSITSSGRITFESPGSDPNSPMSRLTGVVVGT